MTEYGPLSMLTITEAHEETRLPREELYALCRRGEIVCRTSGATGKVLKIWHRSLEAWVRGEPQPASAKPQNVTPIRGYRKQKERRV